jgi:hypothetical protein
LYNQVLGVAGGGFIVVVLWAVGFTGRGHGRGLVVLSGAGSARRAGARFWDEPEETAAGGSVPWGEGFDGEVTALYLWGIKEKEMAWLQALHPVVQALMAGIFTWGVTALGAAWCSSSRASTNGSWTVCSASRRGSW